MGIIEYDALNFDGPVVANHHLNCTDMSVALKTSQFQYIDDFKPSKSRKRRKNPIQPPNALELYTRCAEELKSGSWLEQCHRSCACLSFVSFSPNDNDIRATLTIIRFALVFDQTS